MRFNTIGVSDGISMGTEGMSYSLQSRDLIADSHRDRHARPVVRRQHLASRLRQEHARLPDRHGPRQSAGLMVYGGTIKPGRCDGETLDIVSAFQCYGEFLAGNDRRSEPAAKSCKHACPGAGACGGMYTANTMASAIEALGMSLPYSAVDSGRRPRQARRMLSRRRGDPHSAGARPQAADIMTRRRSRMRWSW